MYNQIFTDDELSNEIWADITGYENLYEISSLGRVRSKTRTHISENNSIEPNMKTVRQTGTGYLTVNLNKNGKLKTCLVHRLVLLSFIGEDKDKPFVDHISGDRTDNRLINLRWVTKVENMNNHVTLERLKTRYPKKVLQFNIDMQLLNEYNSAPEAARAVNGCRIGVITSCTRHIKYLGYIWRYKEDYE